MSDRALLFLFSVVMVIVSLAASGWLVVSGQAGTVDGLFLLLDGPAQLLGRLEARGFAATREDTHIVGLERGGERITIEPGGQLEFSGLARETASACRDALVAHTRSNAFIVFQEANLGSLAPGKYADLLVLDRDYLTVLAGQIKDIRPVMTMVGGKIVFEAKK